MVSELHTKPNLDNAVVRQARIEDIGFILDSWCASYAESPAVKNLDPEVVKVEQRARVRKLLTHAKVTCVVDASDPNRIMGWLCHGIDKSRGFPILHYAYTLKGHRNKGILRNLVNLAGWREGTITWLTHDHFCVRALCKKFDGFILNPYILENL